MRYLFLVAGCLLLASCATATLPGQNTRREADRLTRQAGSPKFQDRHYYPVERR